MKLVHSLALFVFVVSRAIVGAQDDPIPFGAAFAPAFTFSETYREGIVYSTAEESFLDHTISTLSARMRVSMHGLDTSAITNDDRLRLVVGSLSLDLPLGDGSRSIVDGANVVRWRLEGTDPDTGEPISNACTVTLRYDALELTVEITSANAPDDFSIGAPLQAGLEGPVQDESADLEFSVGPYFLEQRPYYLSGTAGLYDTTVRGELFEDLATVNLTGEFDTENPVVRITQPQANSAVEIAPFDVVGTVADNKASASVEVSLNDGPFVEATLNSNGTWRLAAVAFMRGINFLVARAHDESDNVDISPVHVFEYTPRSRLIITSEGNAPGSVSGGFIETLDYLPAQPVKPTEAQLLVGHQYTLTAAPGAGSLFDHWSSNIPLTAAQTRSPRLEFTMAENLTLTAHFVINPFASVQGKYIGLLTSANSGINGSLSGNLTAKGGFSLKAKFGSMTVPIKGRFSNDGHYHRLVVIDGLSYFLDLTLNVTGLGARTISGTIAAGNTSLEVKAELSPFRKSGMPLSTELLGSFNFLLPPSPDTTDPNYPTALGFGRLTTMAAGNGKFTGRLADGTPFSGGTLVSAERRCPLFVSLYGSSGWISGWATLDPNQIDHDLSGVLNWKKPSTIQSIAHRAGFAGQSQLLGARSDEFALIQTFSINPPNQLTLQSPASDILPLSFSMPLNLIRGGRSTSFAPPNSSIRSITCKVNGKTGLLSGTLVEWSIKRKLQGIVLGPKVKQAGGFVLRNGYSTMLRITPPTPSTPAEQLAENFTSP